MPRLRVHHDIPRPSAQVLKLSLMYSGPLSQRIALGTPSNSITCSKLRTLTNF